MNILIVGISGFVGPILAKSLSERFISPKIFGTYFSNISTDYLKVEGITPLFLDIDDISSIEDAIQISKPDFVINLVAQSSVKKSWNNANKTFRTNVIGTINLLETIKKIKPDTRVLLIGSSEQYGIMNKNDINEKSVLNPINPYGISKLAQEKIGLLYASTYNLDIIFTRSFNHTGITQSPQFVIPDWCRQIARIEKGSQDNVIFVGNLDAIRDFSDVTDICSSYVDLLEYGTPHEVYNVGSGKSFSLEKILKILLSYSSIDIRIEKDPMKQRPIENPIIRCNRYKLDKLKNHPYKPFEICLEKILSYWRSQKI